MLKYTVFAYSLAVYALTYFLPTAHWLAGFLMLSLPVVMLFSLVAFLISFVISRKKSWFWGLMFLCSFPFWQRTFGFHFSDIKPADNSFKVMSYNVMSFDVLNYLDRKDTENAPKMIDYAFTADADIKCFQEFYNYEPRPNHPLLGFNTLSQLKKAGYNYKTVLHPFTAQNEENFFGLAIVSKFPIISRGEKEFSNQNGALYADIVIKSDTIRVINVHLRSLIVRFNNFKKAVKNEDLADGKKESKQIFTKLKQGFIHHAEEIRFVERWILDSPYPVMVCGDFNETPYSFAYGTIRKHLANAFEEAGRGFGFSFRNDPKFIRIDNQFFDKKAFQVIDFQTRKNIPYSDHYPVFGVYSLRGR
jgi:endonuclease/exonuclease/phosphatase family metal-dependent hydrolase